MASLCSFPLSSPLLYFFFYSLFLMLFLVTFPLPDTSGNDSKLRGWKRVVKSVTHGMQQQPKNTFLAPCRRAHTEASVWQKWCCQHLYSLSPWLPQYCCVNDSLMDSLLEYQLIYCTSCTLPLYVVQRLDMVDSRHIRIKGKIYILLSLWVPLNLWNETGSVYKIWIW